MTTTDTTADNSTAVGVAAAAPVRPTPAVRLPDRVVRRGHDGPSVRVNDRAFVVGLALLVVTVAVGLVTLATGQFSVPVGTVVRTLLGQDTGGAEFVVEGVRLPRLIVALGVGAALGASGAIFQSISHNPLGSPDIIGFVVGASTGALLQVIVFGGGQFAVAAGAFVGGTLTAVVVYALAYRRGVSGYRLIMVGIGVAFGLQAVNTHLLQRASRLEARGATAWLTGTLNLRDWDHVRPLVAGLVVLLPAALLLGRQLRMLELGDDTAKALGVSVERSRRWLVVVGVGLTAIATASAGPITFVALAAPQLVRRLTRATGPNLLPSAVMGATLLTVSDLVASRALAPTQVPAGVTTALFGGLYLAWLLTHEWRKGRG